MSCDYCDFEFSEEFFPLAVGNEWLYSDNGIYFERWEITDVIDKDGKDIYTLSIFYDGSEGINSGYFYFDNKKLITTLFTVDNDNEEYEYVLADFSLDVGDTLKTNTENAIVIVEQKEKNKIILFEFIGNHSGDKYYPFNMITFEKGKGITDYWVWNWHGNPRLIEYNLN